MRTDIQVQRWPIDRLVPREANPRTHSREQIKNIAIQEFGWTNPILVGAESDIIAGHARLAAARKLGMTEVPVIVLEHFDEAQRRALVIAITSSPFRAPDGMRNCSGPSSLCFATPITTSTWSGSMMPNSRGCSSRKLPRD